MKDNYTDHFTVCWGPGLSTDRVGDKTLSYAIELLLMCTIMIFLNYATWQQLYCQGGMDYLSGKIQLLCVLQEARIAQKNFMQAGNNGPVRVAFSGEAGLPTVLGFLIR